MNEIMGVVCAFILAGCLVEVVVSGLVWLTNRKKTCRHEAVTGVWLPYRYCILCGAQLDD